MTDIEGTDLFKKIKAYNEKSRKEEEQKREEIAEKENSDPFRKIPEQDKLWIQKYLRLSGIQRNKYNQIVDKFKRLSISQISGIMLEVHGYHVSPEMIGKYKRFLIKEGLLKTDKEFEEDRPSEEELRKIRKEGSRAFCIAMSKQKSHLDPRELERILGRKEEKEELTQDRIKELREKQERGLCLTDSEEQELEEYEEFND
jgi:hypothetical protein